MTEAQPAASLASVAAAGLRKALVPTEGMVVSDEASGIAAFDRLKKRVVRQIWTIVALAAFFAGMLPFAHPVYLYYAMNPAQKVMQLSAMTMPNMTNRAILSWATTSITEVMTMGFGDIDVRLPMQKPRFTPRGWKAYIKYFVDQKIGETFKNSQLVLTTVPSNTPVILRQGINLEGIYQWTVQMPVIMTYATNNNVMSRKNATVTLEIVRVPAEENGIGIAIHSWILG